MRSMSIEVREQFLKAYKELCLEYNLYVSNSCCNCMYITESCREEELSEHFKGLEDG